MIRMLHIPALKSQTRNRSFFSSFSIVARQPFILPFQVAKGLYESGYDKDRTEAFEMADIIKGAKLNIENGDPLEVKKHYSHELKNCGIDRRKGALCAILVPELTVLHRDEEDGNHKEDSDTKMILFEKIQNMGQKESAALADYLLPGEANR